MSFFSTIIKPSSLFLFHLIFFIFVLLTFFYLYYHLSRTINKKTKDKPKSQLQAVFKSFCKSTFFFNFLFYMCHCNKSVFKISQNQYHYH